MPKSALRSMARPRLATVPRAAVLVVLGCAALASLPVFAQLDSKFVFAGLGASLVLCLLFFWPDLGTLLFVMGVYTNAAVVFGHAVGSPTVAGVLLIGALCVPVAVALLVRRQGPVLDRTCLGMVLFLGVVLMSTLRAHDAPIALGWVRDYVLEGLVVYFLVVNAVRRLPMLRRVIWALLIVTAFLSSLSIYQEVTHSYSRQFGGLAQRNLERGLGVDARGGLLRTRAGISIANRAAGPIGDPNRYAQILIFVLPLGLFRIWDEKRGVHKAAAALAAALILCGILVTYSRGAFMALAVIGVLLVWLGYIRWRSVLLGAVAGALLVAIVAPGLVARVASIGELPGLISHRSTAQGADGAIRGRLTEMLAACHVFLDYPLLGVGPGQYLPYYSEEYMGDPDVAFRNIAKPRRAHSLYFEMAAELGIAGLGVFLGMVLLALERLWVLRRRWTRTQPERSHLAAAFLFGLLGYMLTAVFLHLSYQRYFWLMMGLAGAAMQILTLPVAAAEPPPLPATSASEHAAVPAVGRRRNGA